MEGLFFVIWVFVSLFVIKRLHLCRDCYVSELTKYAATIIRIRMYLEICCESVCVRTCVLLLVWFYYNARQSVDCCGLSYKTRDSYSAPSTHSPPPKFASRTDNTFALPLVAVLRLIDNIGMYIAYLCVLMQPSFFLFAIRLSINKPQTHLNERLYKTWMKIEFIRCGI